MCVSCRLTPGVIIICIVAVYDTGWRCKFICTCICVCSCLVAGMESDPLPPGSEEPPPPGMDGAGINGGTYIYCFTCTCIIVRLESPWMRVQVDPHRVLSVLSCSSCCYSSSLPFGFTLPSCLPFAFALWFTPLAAHSMSSLASFAISAVRLCLASQSHTSIAVASSVVQAMVL